MNQPLVGIAMPAYNASRFISETIKSVQAQTLSDWELVIVNDGSTDKTMEIIQTFADPRIRLVSQPNQGRGPARARAMRRTRGEYVAFLDADDLWEPEMLQMCINTFKAHPDAGLVHTNWRYLDEFGNKSTTPSYWQPWCGDVLDRLILDLPFITPGVVTKRQALEKVGLLREDTQLIDDWDMWLLLALSGCRFECVDRPLAYYRRHSTNSTHNYEMCYRDQIRVLDNFFAQPNVPEHVKALREKAYAKVHLQYAIGLLRAGFDERAAVALRTAFSLDPELLNMLDTYFSVAASPRSRQGHRDLTIDLPKAERCINVLLQVADVEQPSSETITFRAFYALSQIAYWQCDDARTREWMRQALAAKPASLMQPQIVRWAIRSMLGANRVRQLKR
jgi:glycosyltransferase involved in cell wall biosynthesis